jgi:hypothetical protein
MYATSNKGLPGIVLWAIVFLFCWMTGILQYIVGMGLLLSVVGGFTFGWGVVLGFWAALWLAGYTIGNWFAHLINGFVRGVREP